MGKVSKREFRFNDPCQPCEEGIGCDECDHLPKREESEKSVSSSTENKGESPSARLKELNCETDSRDLFFNSYPIDAMSPEQRKHFKKVMRIEVRG